MLYAIARIDFTNKTYISWTSQFDICPTIPNDGICLCGGYIHSSGVENLLDLYSDVPYASNTVRIGFFDTYAWYGMSEILGIAKEQTDPPLSDYDAVLVREKIEDGYDYELPWIIVHEIGHTYGCDDHTDGRNCVMDIYYLYEMTDEYSTEGGVFCNECLEKIRANRLLH